MTSVCGRTNIGYHELIGRKLFDHGTAKRTNLINNRCMDFSTDDNADTKISHEKKYKLKMEAMKQNSLEYQ